MSDFQCRTENLTRLSFGILLDFFSATGLIAGYENKILSNFKVNSYEFT